MEVIWQDGTRDTEGVAGLTQRSAGSLAEISASH
jgi:hypothetical protein